MNCWNPFHLVHHVSSTLHKTTATPAFAGKTLCHECFEPQNLQILQSRPLQQQMIKQLQISRPKNIDIELDLNFNSSDLTISFFFEQNKYISVRKIVEPTLSRIFKLTWTTPTAAKKCSNSQFFCSENPRQVLGNPGLVLEYPCLVRVFYFLRVSPGLYAKEKNYSNVQKMYSKNKKTCIFSGFSGFGLYFLINLPLSRRIFSWINLFPSKACVQMLPAAYVCTR